MKKLTIFQTTIARVVVAIVALVLPVNIMTLVLSSMVLQKSQEQVRQSIQSNLDISTVNLKNTMLRASRRLTYLSYGDTDFVKMENLPEDMPKNEKAGYLYATSQTLKSVRQEDSMVDLMYFYFQKPDYLISNGSLGVSYQDYRALIEGELEVEQEDGRNWKFCRLGDTSLLFSRSTWNNADFGILLNLERIQNKMNLVPESEGRCIFFMNEAGTLYSEAGNQYLSGQGKTFEEICDSSRYIVFTSEVEGYDLVLVEVLEWEKQIEELPKALFVLQGMAILLTVLVIPLLLWYINRQVRQPLNRLVKAIDRIEQGNLEYRIAQGKSGREFEQINRSFNAMMEQVQDLKIDVYENELEKKDIKMRYLSQQIQPHFILNAMNILYSYEPEEYPLIQKMILCISKYFRYIVKVNADFVELGQEMEHIRNYFEIQKARYPGLFFSIVEYEEGLKRALLPPLLVQNFAENAIKHSLKIGNKITIFVITEYYREGDGPMKMRIRMADTGAGISDELMEQIEAFKRTGEPQAGLGVGIQNAIERLKYLYEDRAHISFWRDENYPGTNVEIILPIYFEKKGEGSDEDSVD